MSTEEEITDETLAVLEEYTKWSPPEDGDFSVYVSEKVYTEYLHKDNPKKFPSYENLLKKKKEKSQHKKKRRFK